MHLNRKAAPTNWPIARKGNKYIVSPASHTYNSISVLLAVRDMLKLATTAAEVKHLIHNKALKLNGRVVRDYKESIKLFDIFEADKEYSLSLLTTGKFVLQETKATTRIAKIISRNLLPGNKLQINLHDGTNVIGKKDMNVGDSLVLDFDNKIKSHKPLEKSAHVFIIGGNFAGQSGIVQSIKGKMITLKINKEESTLKLDNLIVQ
ncbi:MAG: hypothetical protein AABX11_06455 [Nanoarchaeota archaeon]